MAQAYACDLQQRPTGAPCDSALYPLQQELPVSAHLETVCGKLWAMGYGDTTAVFPSSCADISGMFADTTLCLR